MIISTYFIQRRVQELKRQAGNRPHRFCALPEARSLLLFYRASDQQEIEPCLETLRMMRKSVSVYRIGEGLGSTENTIPQAYQLDSSKDLDLWGFPTKAKLQELVGIPADIVIDLCRQENPLIQYLVLSHPSAFKVGTRRIDEEGVCDFSILASERNDLIYLFGQIIFYLQTIRSK